MTFEVGDEVRLRGYTTVGTVTEIREHAYGRWLVVRWHIGGWHTAPEDEWLLEIPTRRSVKIFWWAAGIALGVVFLIGVALSAGQG